MADKNITLVEEGTASGLKVVYKNLSGGGGLYVPAHMIVGADGTYADVTAGHRLKVVATNDDGTNIGGTGGTASTDRATWTAGTTVGTPMEFAFDDSSPASIAEDKVGIARMNANRMQYIVPMDNGAGGALFPAAAALADGTANPTLSQIAAFLEAYNGTTWDRLESDATGKLRVSLYGKNSAAGDTAIQTIGALTDGSSGSALGVAQSASNGSTWDRWRNNSQGTLLASAVRAVTATSAVQTNYNARGVVLGLTITAAPNTAETLTLYAIVEDAITGSSPGASDIALFVTAAGSALQSPDYIYKLFLYPGATSTLDNSTFNKQYSVPIPRNWIAQVVPSSNGNWTYSLSYAYVV